MTCTAKCLGFIVLPAVVLLGLSGWVAAMYFRVGVAEVPEAIEEVSLATPETGDIGQALIMIHRARDRFADVKDYQCLYLRDEFIDRELRKNQIVLKVRHEPFSVYMEWIAPKSKVGRKASYIEGQNNGRMRVKDVLTLVLPPDQSVKMKESRHTILEAGLKNMINRFCERWQKEKELGLTKVLIQDGEVRVTLQDKERVLPCTCVTTIHDPKDKEHFTFYRTLLYFDKETGLPVRMQGFDWPASAADRDGQLLEDYIYLDMKTNLGLADKDFKW